MPEIRGTPGILVESGRPRPVHVELAGRHLGVHEDGQPPRWWDAGKVRDEGGGRFLLEGGSVLEVSDLSLAGRLRQVPRKEEPRLWPKLGMLLAVVVAAGWAIFNHGLPLLADGAARMVPVEYEKKLGDAIADSVAPQASVLKDQNTAEPLARMTAQLARGFVEQPPYQFEVRLLCTREMNAMAAPGGRIIILDGLLAELESPDQLAAVLAHEMQHVALRHGLRAVFRRSALQIGFGLLAGDFTSVAALAAAGLTDLGYSREDEEEADREGLRLMARAGFDPRGMASLFQVFGAREAREGRGASYLRTHPFAADRRAVVEAVLAGMKHAASPGMNVREFQMLKRACPGDTPVPAN